MIEVKNVSKIYKVKKAKEGLFSILQDIFSPSYTEVHSLTNISFSITKGQCYGILGTNGSGKSTMIKMLCGLIQPTNGSVEVLGKKPSARQTDFLKKIGVVFGHKSSLWWDLPLKESFLTQKVIYGVEDDQYEERLEEICIALNLTDLMNRPIKLLSLGERVKAEIAANLLHCPEILFLDEPTVGLDLVSKFELRKFIREWILKNDSIVILTTHDMVDVEACCDHVLLLDKGNIEYDGSYLQVEEDMYSHKILTIKGVDKLLNPDDIKNIIKKIKSVNSESETIDQDRSQVTMKVSKSFHFTDVSNAFDKMEGLDIQLRRLTLEEAMRGYYNRRESND